jgi:hypothetical protein
MEKTLVIPKQNISLAEQQAARKADPGRRGVVGRLAHPPFNTLNEAEELIASGQMTREEAQAYLDMIQSDAVKFSRDYPQCPIASDTEAGQHNRKIISQWLVEHGNLHGTYQNLVQCMNDSCLDLLFDAGRIGMGALGGIRRGSVLAKSASPHQWEMLMQPQPEVEENPEARMSAEAYKQAHKDGWDDLQQEAVNQEREYFRVCFEQFLQLRPAYLRTEANQELIRKTLREWEVRVSVEALCGIFDNLVRPGLMETNQAADLRIPGVRRVDFASTAAAEISSRPNDPTGKVLRAGAWHTLPASRMTANEIEYLCRTNPEFRRALDGESR